AARIYQEALTVLLADLHVVYGPLEEAAERFFEQVGQHDRPPVSVPPRPIEFSGSTLLLIDPSFNTLSWVYLAGSTQSIFSGGELASAIEARALANLRNNFQREIARQVETKANVAVLTAKLTEVVRRPFNDLMYRFDRELKGLMDDSNAMLAALRS